MIPILYEKDETVFASNGLGRLRDCITAKVTEERNGIYELDFEYPVSGAHFEDIIPGRIVAVTHDDTGDVQPFDIVSFTRPISGVVTFHAVHISYRQSGMVASGTSINSLADAFTMLEGASPSNPFTYSADFTSTAYMAAADGTPRSVRQMLGGIEGSILDAYGGEYEWDKFQVILHKSRGVARDFSIRYGVNMTNYQEDTDYQNAFTSCIPYWAGGDGTFVVGTRVDSGGPSWSGRDICVPLDLTDKFENKPTAAQVQAMALQYMAANQSYLPGQNITVDFVRLQDMGYEDLGALMACRLCDTINVVFPFYNTTGQYKIVKTVWDVLADRFESLELGSLSTTLAEALGLSNSLAQGVGLDQIEARVDDLEDDVTALSYDYVIDEGSSGNWKYRKWMSGRVEAWGKQSMGSQTPTSWGGGIYYKELNWAIPSGIFPGAPYSVHLTAGDRQWWVLGYSSASATSISTIRVARPTSSAAALWLIGYAVYTP